MVARVLRNSSTSWTASREASRPATNTRVPVVSGRSSSLTDASKDSVTTASTRVLGREVGPAALVAHQVGERRAAVTWTPLGRPVEPEV